MTESEWIVIDECDLLSAVGVRDERHFHTIQLHEVLRDVRISKSSSENRNHHHTFELEVNWGQCAAVYS